jgi:hypothetical protein
MQEIIIRRTNEHIDSGISYLEQGDLSKLELDINNNEDEIV